MRSYCHHAILQQVILGSPLAALPSKKSSEMKDRKSKKRRKTAAAATASSSVSVFGEFERRDANEPWPSIPPGGGGAPLQLDDKENKEGGDEAKEAFIQICDMCGLHFQVSLAYLCAITKLAK